MLTTAKSANFGFSQAVQLLVPPANPANTARAEKTLDFRPYGRKSSVITDGNQALNFAILCP